MTGEPQTYSITITSDRLEAIRHVLHRACICQNQAIEDSVKRRLGIALHPPKKLLLGLSLIGAAIGIILLARTTADDVLARVFLGGMTIFFGVMFFGLLVLGLDGLKAAVRNRFTNPLIQKTVNRQVDQWIKLAPCAVAYCFFDTSYTASMPELEFERSVLGDEITIAYHAKSVFCLFQKQTSQQWKAVVHAPERDQRNVVEAFLRRNHIEMRELDSDELPCQGQVIEAVAPSGHYHEAVQI